MFCITALCLLIHVIAAQGIRFDAGCECLSLAFLPACLPACLARSLAA